MKTILSLTNVSKFYGQDAPALKDVSLQIPSGEIFALLGPNGAGKTTLIGCATGYVKKTSGSIHVCGFDIDKNPLEAKSFIGLVPQELTLDIFYTVEDTLRFQRGLFGKKRNDTLIQETLTSLSLWEKRKSEVRHLSGGMKRRVLIAKALMNEPEILFLDEPTAGVDVELRHGMWEEITKLKEKGVTIILTTHYLEEAEEMADRIGIIHKGKLIAVDQTSSLLSRFGEKRIDFHLETPITTLPEALSRYKFIITNTGKTLQYFISKNTITPLFLLTELKNFGIYVRDIDTKTSSLEEIFMQLIQKEI
jgi:ABC-2 type transport system ATP-binding protein